MGKQNTRAKRTVDDVNEAWGWVGLAAVEVMGENEFGNLILLDEDGAYWRLSPHALSCQTVADDDEQMAALSYNQRFLHDWYMTELVLLARQTLGPLDAGRKYCLKVPSVLGGEFAGGNLATAPLRDLIRFSGDVAQHYDSAPDCGELLFRPVEEE